MVTISKSMSANQIANYHEKDNYYIKDGLTEKGEWKGELAEKFGLNGEVSKDDLIVFANGYAPGTLDKNDLSKLENFNKEAVALNTEFTKIEKALSKDETNEELLKQKSEIQTKIEDYNKARAEFSNAKNQLIKDGKNDGISMHRAGIDMTFSAPKSVSVAALVGDDKRLIEAHQQAVNKALDYFEKNFSQTRVYNKAGERVKENTENLAIASYTHYTSRSVEGQAPDPQLHTHNVIFNMTQAQDGSFKSLSNEEFYKHQKFADQIYQNELAQKIEKLGYQTEWQKQGSNYTFEIKEMTQANDLFSKRDGQIDEHLAKYEKELGRELTAEERATLKLETRETKGKENLTELKENWTEQLRTNNFDLETMKVNANLSQQNSYITNNLSQSIELALKNLTNTESTFNQHQVFQETAKISQGRFSIDEMKQEFSNFIKDINNLENKLDVTKLADKTTNQNTQIYTTKETIDQEKNILEKMKSGQNTQDPVFSKEQFEARKNEIENFSKLNQGQAQAVQDILTSKDCVLGIQGDPGTGKTFLLGVLREVAGDNVVLRGTSKTGKAVDGMQEESKIDSKTIDSFLNSKNENLKLEDNKSQIWLVDEASMAGTKQLDALIKKAENVGSTKIVLIGDTKQLKAVDGGDMFSKLQREGMNTTIVDQILRQKTELTKSVVQDFKTSEGVKSAIKKLESAGKFFEAKEVEKNGKIIKDTEALKSKLLENVSKDYEEKGINKTTVLVTTNKEKEEINESLRKAAQELNLVDKNDIQINTLAQKKLDEIDKQIASNYAEGDILVAQKMQGDIKTGMNTEVLKVNKEDNTIDIKFTTKAGEEKFKTISADQAKNYQAYEQIEKNFASGDKIMFTKNDKGAEVKNGEIAFIKDISSDGIMTLENKSKGEFVVDTNNYKNIDYAYAMTTHKSQGISEANIHVLAQSGDGINNLNAGFVQVSRASEEIQIYTDDKEKLIGQYESEQIKENASDYIDLNKDDKEVEKDKTDEKDKSFNDKVEDLSKADEKEKEVEKDKTDEKEKEVEKEIETNIDKEKEI